MHNAFDDELISELIEALVAVEKDPLLRVVVLTGRGESFSAGADLNWMRTMADASEHENERDALHLARMMRLLNYLKIPTIARINGPAYGGGLGLVACCDITIAVASANFALTESRLGLAPAVISPYVYRRIGESNARRYFLSGERFSATRARRMGLIQQVVDDQELDSAVERVLGQLLKAGPYTTGHCKKLVFHAAGHDVDVQLRLDQYTARLIAHLRVSAEGQEGISAFLQKRKPSWRV